MPGGGLGFVALGRDGARPPKPVGHLLGWRYLAYVPGGRQALTDRQFNPGGIIRCNAEHESLLFVSAHTPRGWADACLRLANLACARGPADSVGPPLVSTLDRRL